MVKTKVSVNQGHPLNDLTPHRAVLGLAGGCFGEGRDLIETDGILISISRFFEIMLNISYP